MSTPDRLRLDSVASRETDWIVTVAEPTWEPPWEAVSVTVSASSSSWSAAAASVAVAELAPAASASVAGTPL